MADWKNTNLTLRILSALIGIPVIIYIIFLGNPYLLPLTGTIVFIAFFEYLKIQNLYSYLNIILGFSLILVFGLMFYLSNLVFMLILLILVLAIIFNGFYKGIKITGGGCYVSLLFFLVLIRSLPSGFIFAVSVVVMTWIFDIFSYFGGVLYGKHKLAPLLSPGKSYEGLITGLVIVIAAGMGLGYLPVFFRAILGMFIGISSLAGDLIESKIKRLSNVKDSSSIIPGHGGFFDRFDSLILSAPTGYFLIVLFLRLGH